MCTKLCSNSFNVVKICPKLFQGVPKCSKGFQCVLMKGVARCGQKVVPRGCIGYQVIQICSKGFQRVLGGSHEKLFQEVPREHHLFELHGLGRLCLRLARRASRRRAVGAGPKGPRRRRLGCRPKAGKLVAYIFNALVSRG